MPHSVENALVREFGRVRDASTVSGRGGGCESRSYEFVRLLESVARLAGSVLAEGEDERCGGCCSCARSYGESLDEVGSFSKEGRARESGVRSGGGALVVEDDVFHPACAGLETSEFDNELPESVSSSGRGVSPGVGPNGGTSYGRGSNYDRNQAARERKKVKGTRARGGNRVDSWNKDKKRAEELIKSAVPNGVESVSLGGPMQVNLVSGEKTDLQKSSELKWRTQNELAALKAEREIAILKATDLEEEKRKRRAQICAATERNLVSIERFHGDLRKSGNTSSDDDTRVNTIVSAGSGSISPSSSISEADVRRAKKELEDAIAERKKEKSDKEKLAAALIRMGQNPEAIIGYGTADVDLDAKTEWTVDSKGRITDDNEAILDVIYPDGYMVIHDDVDFVHPDGKNKVRLVGGPRYSVAGPVVEEDDDDAKTHWSLESYNRIPDATALKLHEKFPDGYRQNFDSYTDAVTGKLRGVIRPTALAPRVPV